MQVLLGNNASLDTKIIEESCIDIMNNRVERKTQAVGVNAWMEPKLLCINGWDSKRVRYE